VNVCFKSTLTSA